VLPHPEDGGSRVILNIGILPQHYMMLQPRRPYLVFKEFPTKLYTSSAGHVNHASMFMLPNPKINYVTADEIIINS
jgi:hypothetical protein